MLRQADDGAFQFPAQEAADKVAGGQIVATWDPHTHPVITEVGGHIKFQDFVDGLTVTTQVDEVTGLSSTVVLDSKQRGGKDLRPTVKLLNAKGKEAFFANTEIPAVYTLPPGALIASCSPSNAGAAQSGSSAARLA